MNHRFLLLLAILGAAGIWAWVRHGERLRVIEYRGEEIRLSRPYGDFDDYKNDPNNIDPSDTTRVQTLVRQAPIASSFPDRLSLFRATQSIVFPGYGSGSGSGVLPDGSELLAIVIEIPRAQQDRLLLFKSRGGPYELLDDFLQAEARMRYPFSIRVDQGFYIFESSDRKELFRRAALR